VNRLEEATSILFYYIKGAYEAAGASLSSDARSEIEDAIKKLVEAAKQEALEALQESEKW
jgi:hypothetical protein